MKEQTHPRHNENVTGFHKDRGVTTSMVQACDREKGRHMLRKVLRTDIPGKMKRGRQKQDGKACAN